MKIFMKLKYFRSAILTVLGILLMGATVQAKEMSLVFFYPGGEGSASQATPVLEEFSAALQEASGGKIKAKVHYLSELKAGEAFIQNKKPAGGILAYDLFLAEGAKWQAKAILQTLQFPSSNGWDQYFLIGNKSASLPSTGEITVLSARPLRESFVKEKLFPQNGLTWKITPTQNVVGKLRRLGMNDPETKDQWILLDQFAWKNVSRLRAAWVAGLKPALSSEKIPSAPFVVFGNTLNEAEITQLKSALEKMSQSERGKKVLQLLRLAGFGQATS